MRGAEGRAGTYHDKHDGLVVCCLRLGLLREYRVFVLLGLYTPGGATKTGRVPSWSLALKVVRLRGNPASQPGSVPQMAHIVGIVWSTEEPEPDRIVHREPWIWHLVDPFSPDPDMVKNPFRL